MTARRDPSVPLHLARVVEDGHVFETGRPVTFPFFRYTRGPTAYHGATYGQDIEPAGLYLLHVEHPIRTPPGQSEVGMVAFTNPLVLELSVDQAAIYGPGGWKARLARHFGATGRALSRKLLAAGYDGIVTVRDGATSEIVDLSVVGKPTRRNPSAASPPRGPFTLAEARAALRAIGRQAGITGLAMPPKHLAQLRRGMNIELEHGRRAPLTDVTGDDPVLTAKIALAHLRERPDYYDRLAKMEAPRRGAKRR